MRTSISSPSPVRRRRLTARLLAAASAVGATLSLMPAADAATLSSSPMHVCAVADGGTVKCWGNGEFGELGDGASVDRATPTQVAGIATATEVAVGYQFSCALLADHTVKCWGANSLGQLGDATAIDSPTPVQVAGLTDAVAIAGDGPVCALRAGGTISCWGHQVPGNFNGMFSWSAAPVALEGATGAVDLTVTGDEVCAIGTTSTSCWTFRQHDAFGSSVASPTPVPVANSSRIQQRAGSCSLLASGQVGCEGWNTYGELGNGLPGNYVLPRGSSLVKGLTDARAISAGRCALREAGTVVCWGPTQNGLPAALGGPDSSTVAVPTLRTDLHDIRALAATCAVNSAGTAFCWGNNGEGQLGNGTRVPSSKTVEVTGLTVAPSARDAITPVRRDEPDLDIVDVVPPSATTPTGSTPSGTTPVGTTPGIPGIDFGLQARTLPIAATPALLLKGKSVILNAFPVGSRRSGRCPSRAKVTIKSGRRSKSRTLKVRTGKDGGCQVSGSVRLKGRLSRANKLTVTVKPRGVKRTVKRLHR